MTRAASTTWSRRPRRRLPARRPMGDLIEFDPVDALGAGAFGIPGQRVFVIQARKGEAVLSVLVEKEQVALLATEASEFLDGLDEKFPDDVIAAAAPVGSGPVDEAEPL